MSDVQSTVLKGQLRTTMPARQDGVQQPADLRILLPSLQLQKEKSGMAAILILATRTNRSSIPRVQASAPVIRKSICW